LVASKLRIAVRNASGALDGTASASISTSTALGAMDLVGAESGSIDRPFGCIKYALGNFAACNGFTPGGAPRMARRRTPAEAVRRIAPAKAVWRTPARLPAKGHPRAHDTMGRS
jgi:hypothetical protein